MSSDVARIFTSVPLKEVIGKGRQGRLVLTESTVLGVQAIMEIMEICFKTTYFHLVSSSRSYEK
jgi:hypothetical protein